MRHSLVFFVLLTACSTTTTTSDQQPAPDYRSVGDSSEVAESEPDADAVPNCDGLEGGFLDKCRRGLAVLRSMCPEAKVTGDGCEICPEHPALDDGPKPYGFRDIEAAIDSDEAATESQILLMEGCRADERLTVVLAAPGDPERPWIVEAIEPATEFDLSKYRIVSECLQTEEGISTAQCSRRLQIPVKNKRTPPVMTPVKPMIEGDISLSEIRRTIRSARRQLRFCYETQIKREPHLRGLIQFELELAASGDVIDVTQLIDEVASKAVSRCLATRLSRLTFTATGDGEGATIRLGFRFAPGS